MKVYRAIEERGLVLSFHSNVFWSNSTSLLQPVHLGACARLLLVQHPPSCTNWVINGLGERFPKLPVIWIKSGLAWVPFLMQKLDHEYMLRPSEAPLLKRKPSDYMREMYYSSQPMEIQDMGALENTFRMINAETQLIYASDYPHWDFDPPATISTSRGCRRKRSTTFSAAPRRGCSSCRRATRSRRITWSSSATILQQPELRRSVPSEPGRHLVSPRVVWC